MEKHGVKDVNFARFIADCIQTNFNIVREVFGSRNKSKSMLRKKRTYQSHWSQILDQHTKQIIKLEI